MPNDFSFGWYYFFNPSAGKGHSLKRSFNASSVFDVSTTKLMKVRKVDFSFACKRFSTVSPQSSFRNFLDEFNTAFQS